MNTVILDRLDSMEAWVRRRRWWIRLAVALVLIPWLGHFVYTRMTTRVSPVPARYVERSNSAAATNGASYHAGDLIQAVRALPKVPRLLPPASNTSWQPIAPGMYTWGANELDLQEALRGEWAPSRRYHLQQIVQYLHSPAVEKALKGIAAVADRPLVLPGDPLPRYDVQQSLNVAEKMLLARARERMVENRDVDAAIADLRIVMQLSLAAERAAAHFSSYGTFDFRGMCLRELGFWAREFDLPADQIQALKKVASDCYQDPRQAWRQLLQAQKAAYEGLLDTHYTRDADGNGWPVIWRGDPGEEFHLLLCTLNLMGVAMNDRATMRRKMEQGFEAMEQIGELPPAVLTQIVMYGMDRRALGNQTPVDYVFADIEQGLLYARWQSLGGLAWHAGAVTGLALAAYNGEHGSYPKDLTALVGKYLPALPDDPYDIGPVRYYLDEEDGAIVYSMGPPGDENRQVAAQSDYWRIRPYRTHMMIWGPRAKPVTEWILAPATGTAGNANGNNQGQ